MIYYPLSTPQRTHARGEDCQVLKIGGPEEVAWRQGRLTDEELARPAEPLGKSGYGSYLLGLLADPTGGRS